MKAKAEYGEKGSNSNIIFLIFSLVIFLIGIIFALQNAHQIDINFLGWSYQGSLALIIVITLVLGIMIGVFTALSNIYKRDKIISYQALDLKRLEEENRKLKDEVSFLSKKGYEENRPQTPPDVSETTG
jgi:lipopolysaccharide assembly protein A